MREDSRRLLLGDPNLPPVGDRIYKAGYNPAEPRNKRGRWTRDGSGTEAAISAAYRGHFHDLVVTDFLAGLRSSGATVLKNVPVLGVNGILAIPDGASKPSETVKPYFIEMKTGNDPKFTENQKRVYPLICAGGHATSFDTRISQLGLVAGVPFPAMRVLIVTTEGPGMHLGSSTIVNLLAWRCIDMLDQAAAAALFSIVVGGTQGQEALAKQQPLHVEDKGDAYLVVGSPYTKGKLVRFVKCHVFFAKHDSEVLGFGCDGRQILSDAEELDWRRKMTAEQFDTAFGEAFCWERDGVRGELVALYGGVVNTPHAAVAYAKVLLQTTERGRMLSQGLLTAVERDKVWHIVRVPDQTDVMTLSRTTGKRLSRLP